MGIENLSELKAIRAEEWNARTRATNALVYNLKVIRSIIGKVQPHSDELERWLQSAKVTLGLQYVNNIEAVHLTSLAEGWSLMRDAFPNETFYAVNVSSRINESERNFIMPKPLLSDRIEELAQATRRLAYTAKARRIEADSRSENKGLLKEIAQKKDELRILEERLSASHDPEDAERVRRKSRASGRW